MLKWLLTVVVILVVVGLGATVNWWLPPLLPSIDKQGPRIQTIADAVQLVLWTGAGIWAFVRIVWGIKKRPTREDGSISSRRDTIVARENAVAAKTIIAGHDIHGDVIVIADPEQFLKAEPEAKSVEDVHQTLKFYLKYLVEHYQYLDFRGMGVFDKVPLKLPLAEMYVPLRARVELPKGETHDHERIFLAGRRASAEEIESMGERLSKPQPLLKLLNDNEGLVILGDPGAGKTTFLKYLTLKLAMGQGGELGLENRLPVLVPLSEYANALVKGDVRLDRFVSKYYDDLVIGLPVGAMLDDALKRGEALILLDGLDEVKEQGRRQDVVKRVEHFFASAKQQGNKFVMTSRIVGYREVRPAAKGLAECTLDDFNDEDIAEFLAKWTAALEKAARGDTAFAVEEAARERRELQNALNRNVGVRRLASNPLLLTILALMKRQGVVLPERRVELYQKYIETLLKYWNLARGLGRAPERDLDVLETVRVLAPLALWMHETSPGVGLVKREGAWRKLEEIYAGRGHSDPAAATRQLLDDVRAYAGLLLERGPGTYGFIHLTFQEYLAAVAVAFMGPLNIEPIIEALRKRVGDDNWHEVFLLAIAYLGVIQGRPEAAGDVLRQLIELPAGQPGVAAVWAGEAVWDAGTSGVTPECRANVVQWLLDAMRDGKAQPVTRAAAGRTLAKLGDTRPGAVGLLRTEGKAAVPDMEMCFVPAGPFWMGSDEADKYADDDEKPARLNEHLNYDYWIGRYPVTVAQFQWFVDDPEGYRNDKWWTKAGLKRRGKRAGPDVPGEPFNLPNHPVVGVTWYEALAFTRWLTARWRSVETRYIASLPDGWEVRLPSEAEWEKAARGGVQIPEEPVIVRVGGDPHPGLPPPGGREKNPNGKRPYPWGNEPDPNRANYSDTGVGTTSAVGCFPGGASPYGCEDMSGNVWEWCATKWQSSYSDYQDDNTPDGDAARVLRGGAFGNGGGLVRCAFRRRSFPGSIGVYGGFRVAAGFRPFH